MSGRAAGFAAGIAIRLLIKALKRKRRHIEEATPPQLTKEQIDQYIVDTTIDEAYEQLQAEYDRAYKELLEREKQVEDPYIRKLIEKNKNTPQTIQAKKQNGATMDANSNTTKRSPKTRNKRQRQNIPIHPQSKLGIRQTNSPNTTTQTLPRKTPKSLRRTHKKPILHPRRTNSNDKRSK